MTGPDLELADRESRTHAVNAAGAAAAGSAVVVDTDKASGRNDYSQPEQLPVRNKVRSKCEKRILALID